MILAAVVASCFGVLQYPHSDFNIGETVLYRSRGVTQGRVLFHRTGLKLGEVTGVDPSGQVRVTPWDYPNRFYPGGVVGLDGKPKDGSEVLPVSEVFHEIPCIRSESGSEYRVGAVRQLQVGRSRFEDRHAMRIFENGSALFFREQRDEEAYSSFGNRLFLEKLAPTMIRTLVPQQEE
jgi:hypothetical protein